MFILTKCILHTLWSLGMSWHITGYSRERYMLLLLLLASGRKLCYVWRPVGLKRNPFTIPALTITNSALIQPRWLSRKLFFFLTPPLPKTLFAVARGKTLVASRAGRSMSEPSFVLCCLLTDLMSSSWPKTIPASWLQKVVVMLAFLMHTRFFPTCAGWRGERGECLEQSEDCVVGQDWIVTHGACEGSEEMWKWWEEHCNREFFYIYIYEYIY